jgi:hypothetical protein
VFGFLGLIVGIGLTVYLGAQAMSGVGGSSGKDRTTTRNPDEAAQRLGDELKGLTGDTVLGLEPSGATLTITAPGGLADGARATVTGAQLSPGPGELLTCLAAGSASGEAPRCDESTRAAVTVDATGSLRSAYPARRVVHVGGTAYDCAARAGSCVVMLHRPDNPLVSGTTAALTFAGGLPPVDAEPPPGG